MLKKKETSPKALCEGFPKELERYVEYTRNMEYTEEPDYDMLRSLFMKIMRKEGYKFDYIYDWTTPEEKKMRKAITIKTDIESQNMRTTATKKKGINPFKREAINEGDDAYDGGDYSDNNDEDDGDNKNRAKIYRRNSTEAVAGTVNQSKSIKKLKSQENIALSNINNGYETQEKNYKNDQVEDVCCSAACLIY